MVIGNLHVDVLREGVHSGEASGIVPSSFRIARSLLDRLEDAETGRILPEWLYVPIPEQRVAQARAMAGALGAGIANHYPWRGATARDRRRRRADPESHLAPAARDHGRRRPAAAGSAGNVLRAGTALRVSLRLPPGVVVRARDGAD